MKATPQVPKILSLDLGITTGYAVYQRPGTHLIAYGDIEEERFDLDLRELVRQFTPAEVVVEAPVIVRGELGNRLQTLVTYAHVILHPHVLFVDAARWKPTPYAKAECPKGLSQHARDAIRLGLWFDNYLQRSS